MVPNERNRMMYVTLKFAHFEEIGKTGETLLFGNNLSEAAVFPHYVRLIAKQIRS
jgi:hypothetical protein